MAPLSLVLVGGGGHASDVLQAIEAVNQEQHSFNVLGAVADQFVSRRFASRGVGRVGGIADIGDLGAQYVLCIGWPWLRREVADRIGNVARPAQAIIHPRADVGAGVELGPGTVVLGNAHVSPMVRMGAHSLVSYNSSIGHDAVFGAFASVMPNAAVSGDVVAGDEVLVGAGAVILEGVRLGDRVRVGAGAVVIDDVADGLTVVGVPAKPLN